MVVNSARHYEGIQCHLSVHSEMVKMANFMLCVLCHKKEKKKKKVKSHKLSQSLAKKIDGPGYC